MSDINKICIIGGPGTGKTTLARNLGKILNLPTYYIDGIAHFANWEKRNKEEREKILLEKIQEDKWVIDGTYKASLEKRIQMSDLVIFLNYSSFAKLKGIVTRYIKGRGKEKLEIPGCKEKIDWEFLKYTATWNKYERDKIKEILNRNSDKNILIFSNRKKLNKWYENKFKRIIEI